MTKRYIIIRTNTGYDTSGDYETMVEQYQTDDVREGIAKLAEAGYDIGVELEEEEGEEVGLKAVPDSVEEVAAELIATKRWGIGDGADDLLLVDTQENIQDAADLPAGY